MEILQIILWFFVAIIVLVTVHEFGHFYVARRCGVKVLRFSVGFGKVLARWHDRTGTEYALSAIPLGGYVKMLDEREGEVAEDELHMAFNRKSVWRRIAVVVAGPAANFILAVLIFWLVLFSAGERGLVPIIGAVASDSIAEQANLEVGHEIIAVDGVVTTSWQDVQKQLLRRLGESGIIRFKVSYPNSSLQYESTAELDNWLRKAVDPNPIEAIGLKPYIPVVLPRAGMILPDSPAEQAGLQTGDLIVSANGEPMPTANDWVNYVKVRPNQVMSVKINRDGQALRLSMTPDAIEGPEGSFGRVGMGFSGWPEGVLRESSFTVSNAFVKAVHKTWETSAFVLLSVKKLILGEVSTKNLSGAITIAKVAGSEAKGGWERFLGFLALLSVSLGVFNLLPIPVLDGGHLMYYIAELIKGTPVSQKVQMIGYQMGLMMVVGLTVLALYNDILRL